MAKVDVIMPQMGESIAEGTLSRWMKKVGDAVKRDEPIFEISTDKVDAEIPAPQAGVLVEILVQEGQTVAAQTVVARLETDASAAAAAPAPAPAAPAPAPAPAAVPTPAPAAPKPAAAAPVPASPVTASPPPAPTGPETAEERLRRKSTPLVRKIAAEHNLDISAISGSGLAGRVTKSDVLSYLESAPTPPLPSSPAAPPAGPAASTGRGASRLIEVPAPVVEPWEGDRVEPWSKIRKLTADHMIMSRRVSAHVNSLFEVDFTRVAQVRAARKKEYAERGVNLTFLAFIVKAVADTIRKHPVVNSAVMGDATVFRRDINIGIAVALDWGLIVPVIKRADELSLLGVARAINDLGERARAKKLTPDEVQRGTFTITNPGGFGSFAGTPIINQPQVAILGIGSIEKRPHVVTLPDGTDTLAIRTKGMFTMAYDHRIVDGADADRFLADLKAMLQSFPDTAA
ncbi:MAG TPA: dihydrolipoamide acetyltransferase family protein [Gemmatimonadales bacterium]|nr:dihydrolipoamide acetyltransferase family protein [Gemmatimonadales bacterium]